MDKTNIYKWFFGFLFLIIFYLLFKVLKPFFIPLLWSVVLATILFPVYKKLNEIVKNRRNVSSTIMIILTTLIIILPILLLFTSLAIESYDFYSTLQTGDKIAKIKSELSTITDNKIIETIVPHQILVEIRSRFDIEQMDIVGLLSSTVINTSKGIVNIAQNIAKNVTLYVINFGIMLFALFFFFRDGERFYSYLINTIPMDDIEKSDITSIFSKTIYVTVIGNLAVAAVQGLLVAVIFMILGIGYPVLAGFLCFILSILPLVGAAFIWFPVALILMFNGSPTQGVILLCYGVFVISVSDNLLRPIIIGKQVKLHTLFLFLAILGGIQYFGFSGIIIGPVLLALFISFVEIYRKKFLGIENKAV